MTLKPLEGSGPPLVPEERTELTEADVERIAERVIAKYMAGFHPQPINPYPWPPHPYQPYYPNYPQVWCEISDITRGQLQNAVQAEVFIHHEGVNE